MRNRIPEDAGTIVVPMTTVQAKRVAGLMAAANQAAGLRDAVLSAIIEGTTDRDLTGWALQVNETDIVLTPPTMPGSSLRSNGQSQADVMSP